MCTPYGVWSSFKESGGSSELSGEKRVGNLEDAVAFSREQGRWNVPQRASRHLSPSN